MTIEVAEPEDGSLKISWDADDPVESMLNDFTEQDFIDIIIDACEYSASIENYCCEKERKDKDRSESADKG